MKKCLVVDDSKVIRKVAMAILADMDIETFEAEETSTALKLCQTKMPDLVLLDWHIPGDDPIEFLNDLRASFSGRRPQVIYLTTEKDPDIVSRAIDAGADDYLLKPFDRATFVSKFAEFKKRAA